MSKSNYNPKPVNDLPDLKENEDEIEKDKKGIGIDQQNVKAEAINEQERNQDSPIENIEIGIQQNNELKKQEDPNFLTIVKDETADDEPCRKDEDLGDTPNSNCKYDLMRVKF